MTMPIDTNRLQLEIEDITERYRAAGYFPSACVRVFDRQGTLASACVGEAREDSLFDAASLTKIATTLQVLRLITSGELTLEEEICGAGGADGCAYINKLYKIFHVYCSFQNIFRGLGKKFPI